MDPQRQTDDDCVRGTIVFAHGSRDPLWRVPIEAVARHIQSLAPQLHVRCAYLELMLPDLPTMREVGVPGFDDVNSRYTMLAPAGTPAAIVQRLNAASRTLLEDPEVKAQAAPQGVVLTASTPDEFASFLRSEVALWAKVVKDSGVKAE